ncbi:MFS transporter, partial [Streptomyces sp. SID11233]|nr:MFS transporter [Streptomyces sp. SID11233]
SPATLMLVNTRFEEGPQRNRALAVWGACGSGGLAAGALLGGLLTNAWGWEWVLFILVPLALLAAVAAPSILPADERSASDSTFDVPGALLATAGSSLLVLGLVSGP